MTSLLIIATAAFLLGLAYAVGWALQKRGSNE